MTICSAIREIRTEAGMSLPEAATRFGVSPQTLEDIESSRRPPTIAVIEAVAATFGEDPQARSTRASNAYASATPKLRSAMDRMMAIWERNAAVAHAAETVQ